MHKANERETAVFILMDITKENLYNNIILRKTLEGNPQLSTVQKAFITEMVNGTLRNLILIDYMINQISKTQTTKMKPFILNTLRISVYQIKFMDKVPESAICNEAVLLVKKHGFTSLSGFVNGVVRNMIRNINVLKFPDPSNKIKYLSTMYSYPEWIIKLWLAEYNFHEVENICKKQLESPKVTVCVNSLKTDKNTLKNIFESEGIDVTEGLYGHDSLVLTRTSNIGKLKSFEEGLFHVQDQSSMLAVAVLDPKEGQSILDVCSAPGGKSFCASYKMNNKGEILARDVHEHKINLIEESIKRLGIEIIKTELKDALEEMDEQFDAVLVDAPCSGLGLLQKKPDIKYNKSEKDIKELVILQRKILEATAKKVKVGGTLVYSTCTISKVENIENVNWFVENFPYELEDVTPYLPAEIAEDTKEQGYVQLLPQKHNIDGFFIARMKRKG